MRLQIVNIEPNTTVGLVERLKQSISSWSRCATSSSSAKNLLQWKNNLIVPGGRGMGNVSVVFLEVMGCMSQYHITVSVSARIGETSFVPCSILD